MTSPCKNCITLPVCNHKSAYMRIERCPMVKEYIANSIVERTETGQILLPRYIVTIGISFEVTHFPMQTSPGEDYLSGIGIQSTERRYSQPHVSHIVLATVSGHKEIHNNENKPVVSVKL